MKTIDHKTKLMDLHPSPRSDDLAILIEASAQLQTGDPEDALCTLLGLAARAADASNAGLAIYRGQRVQWQHTLYEQNTPPGPTRSALSMPVGTMTAVLTLVHTHDNHFTDDRVRIVKAIAHHTASVIERMHLYRQDHTRRRQINAMLRTFPDHLLAMDRVGRITFVSDAMLDMLGDRAREMVLGERLTDVHDRDDSLNIVCEALLNGLNGQTPVSLVFEARSQRMKQDYEVTVSSWHTDSGDIDGFLLVMHDVTHLHDLHRFKDEMLHIASHDLRSPLALIIGYADMIRLDVSDLNDPIHQYVDAINRSAKRMDSLLRDLLRIEQIRNSPSDLHEVIHPKPLIERVLENMEPEAQSKQIKFGAQLNLDFVDTFIRADQTLIRQAMENFVSNALKYTPKGGSVAIISRFDFDEQRFHFVVADTGIGIAEDKLPYVFERFYRVDRPEVAAAQGTGLGLSLVKSVIQQHQGEVWVTSVEDEGSRFGFWLPLVINPPEIQG